MAIGYEVEGIENRWIIFKTAPDIVTEKFELTTGIAQTAYANTVETLNRLAALAEALELINRTITIDTTDVPMPDLTDLTTPTIDISLFRVETPETPTEPTLIEATLDTIPSNFPDLSVGEITGGDTTYVTSLITALKSKLLNDLQTGSTGVSADVENSIWYREYERMLLAHNEAMDRISAEWSKRGFPLPSGALTSMLQEEEINYTNKRLDMSRDVAIKSFELALTNSHFIIQQTVALEARLMDFANAVAQRVYEVSKAVVDSAIAAYSARTDGVYKQALTIIEKMKAKIEYNMGLIKIYAEKVNAYSAKMNAESSRINAVARGYEAQMGVFNSIVNFETKKADLTLNVIKMRLEQAIANAGLLIKDKEIEMKNYELINSLREKAEEAIGAIVAQLTAGALSAVHAQASISAENRGNYEFSSNPSY